MLLEGEHLLDRHFVGKAGDVVQGAAPLGRKSGASGLVRLSGVIRVMTSLRVSPTGVPAMSPCLGPARPERSHPARIDAPAVGVHGDHFAGGEPGGGLPGVEQRREAELPGHVGQMAGDPAPVGDHRRGPAQEGGPGGMREGGDQDRPFGELQEVQVVGHQVNRAGGHPGAGQFSALEQDGIRPRPRARGCSGGPPAVLRAGSAGSGSCRPGRGTTRCPGGLENALPGSGQCGPGPGPGHP